MARDIKLSTVIINILVKVTRLLKKHKISYAVMGGIALQAWGRERVTRDLDLTISLSGTGQKDFLKILKIENLQLVLPEKEKRIGSFRLIETHYTSPRLGIPIGVDFFIAQTEYQKEALGRAVSVDVMGHRFKLISPEDLIIHKLLSDRPIDRCDAESIVVEQKARLDKEYLFYWAKTLGIPRRMKLLWKADSSSKDRF